MYRTMKNDTQETIVFEYLGLMTKHIKNRYFTADIVDL